MHAKRNYLRCWAASPAERPAFTVTASVNYLLAFSITERNQGTFGTKWQIPITRYSFCGRSRAALICKVRAVCVKLLYGVTTSKWRRVKRKHKITFCCKFSKCFATAVSLFWLVLEIFSNATSLRQRYNRQHKIISATQNANVKMEQSTVAITTEKTI